MTTAEAAARLGVSQRQVQRLVAAGMIAESRIVGRSLLVDAGDVVALAGRDRHRGRPWSEPVAWAALWRLSGLEAAWLDAQAGRRLSRRLAGVDVDGLLWACRGRARVEGYRASASYLAEVRRSVVPSGASGLDRSRDLMAAPADRVDGYCTAAARDRMVEECFLAADPQGDVTLRVTDFAAVGGWEGVMPLAVVAADLAESADPREAGVGRGLLGRLLA
ncbi:MAG: helix-turn-helix domain-containing protein [Propionibacteriaceae bacterium]|jgi:excisionase family DNA binding protein|nr:helix-turn-helix domain-containing protein [Propionibacteriaceae bacterium]